MRGLLRHLNSRIYFPDGPGNSEDLVLSLVEPGRRDTLVAREVAPGMFEWDVRLQGESETVFFDF
jgi:protocatechuate 3,4-dioxygenase alpha subunit